MYSIRRRLMLVLAAGFAVLLLGTGVYVQQLLREQVTREFDATLLARVRALATLTEQEAGAIEFDYVPALMPEFEREDRPDYLQYWLEDGTVIHRSRHLHQRDLPRFAAVATEPRIRDATLPDGRAGRLVELAFVPKGPDEIDEEEAGAASAGPFHTVVLVVARGRERLDRLLGAMRIAIFGAGGVTILLAVLFIWRSLVSGLRPLERIATQVEALDAESLDSRIRLTHTPTELAPIVDQLNAMLDRLDASFARERRFAGNVAHELRTPIAELRSLAEVGAKWPDDQASVVGFFEDVRDVAGRMERVIADMLLLARCQAGVEPVVCAPVDLKQAVEESWARLERGAAGSVARFRLDCPEDLTLEADASKLEIVLANLLGNAVSHALPESEVVCTGDREAAGVRIEITNAAERLSPAELDRLAEPFWRKDESRSSSEHAGLGLSVASALAQLMGFEVSFSQDEDGTFHAKLLLRLGGIT